MPEHTIFDCILVHHFARYTHTMKEIKYAINECANINTQRHTYIERNKFNLCKAHQIRHRIYYSIMFPVCGNLGVPKNTIYFMMKRNSIKRITQIGKVFTFLRSSSARSFFFLIYFWFDFHFYCVAVFSRIWWMCYTFMCASILWHKIIGARVDDQSTG